MISTHILDTHLGKPAQDVKVILLNAKREILASTVTNSDGRIQNFSLSDDLGELVIGEYSLEFYTGSYFQHLGLETFFPKAVIHFYIKDERQHYHIPLLISPFAYSTYRGS